MRNRWWIGLAVLMLVACNRLAPQRPSQRMGQVPQVDTAQLALLQLNRQLAEAADNLLMQTAQAQDEAYALYEANTWVTILDPGNTESASPVPGEEWTVHMRTYTLTGELYTDSEGTYRIGKQELPIAVDVNICEWHRGCRIRMYAPWYAAYGIKGTDEIPPYENVMIELELK